ncbi:ABC transporter ATP-binding protein [Eubacterium oxidoreducens]|uniref:NitT/TauT family transport system ATP-binding protein n=1 Tax=Eubacterium oxidoreducens TaxID=1732 RepID=A0A1G6A233_EUBOX|nr:ABC transporter ATP-binding protein [Eubacterium oxidoreducens]SDB02521.1 NitT/TauT family transport system ATP-binding protein [Eubacterium oxidoreducens]
MSKIEIQNLTVDYKEKNSHFTALKDVSFSVDSGEFVSLIGSSGCGKSTLLSMLEGIKFPTSGTISIDGEQVRGTGTDRGVVFQHYSLFPWMTARKNVAFGVKQVKKNSTKEERLKIADEFLNKVGLENFKNKYPGQLSGGMQQRVAIARALAMNTEILLMDEPFGAIDAKNRTILQELLLKLWEGDGKQEKKTVVFVTHDIDEAILLSDRIVMMSTNPGRVYKEIKVPFERPRNRAKLVQTKEYGAFRNELLAMFYSDIVNKIGGNEVVL